MKSYHIILLLYLTFITYKTSALECYTSFNQRNNSCSAKSNRYFQETPKTCCERSKAVAYSLSSPAVNETIPCESCAPIRKKYELVFCFQTICGNDGRGCHNMHKYLTTLFDCCIHRGARDNNTAQGFDYHLQYKKSSIEKTFACIPCKEKIVTAQWTEWSECSVSCGGGLKKRDKLCPKVNLSPDAICYDFKSEITKCNLQSCPQNLSTLTIVLIVITSLIPILLVLAGIIIYKCMNKRKYPALESVIKLNDHPMQQNCCEQDAINPRYQPAPKRALPNLPAENFLRQISETSNAYEYVNYNEENDYLPMSRN